MKKIKKSISILLISLMMLIMMAGCAQTAVEEPEDDNVSSDNIVLTETGEVLKIPQPTEKAEPSSEIKQEPRPQQKMELPEQLADVVLPEDEQVMDEEDNVEEGNALQIVFLGDSIFDSSRDGTGIPYLTAIQCDADMYNLAIGGTRASLQYDESPDREQWTTQSLLSVVEVLRGKIPTDSFEGTRAKKLMDKTDVDWSNTDYFVVEYGMNDFLSAAPISAEETMFNLYSYSGALRYAVSNLLELANDATIILCCPNYAQFFNGDGAFIGDGNSLHNGYGTLADYAGICQYVAKEQGAVFFDAYLDLGIDGYTAEDYLEDGIHLTAEGRQLYADALAQMILKIEETKNN